MTAATIIDLRLKLPKEYYSQANYFRYKDDFKLSKHSRSDYAINLKLDLELPNKRLYAINANQLIVVKKYINKELAKGTIERSNSEYALPVLIVRKPQGGLRVYVNYRTLNAITIKDRYPIPLIRETLDRLYKARQFTKLDIVVAFNNLRIREGNKYLTAFITRYRLY